ncbi:TRAP transporter small permease subunit [Mesobaculum littorinae]|uniref:TRAP transporter small permease subunit n=1 Tax=Mesobaculum littorinae TaxID=2486419 RepID=A0A438AMX3_9RHOB|nr:TRAP transporter small permease subunit [Mesobaculum littorinae]RVV99960.1 TRAP transporter small permease subunit [Mesobaculum littorinae]
MEFIIWLVSQIGLAFWHFFYAITHPGLWLDWSNGEALMRFIYYGGSVEFFFVVFVAFLVVTAVGLWSNRFMWGCVRGLEGMANGLGRLFAWAGLLMVIQQIVIVFMQRVFAASSISVGFGSVFQFDVSWWSEELKLYNALIVTLCAGYTFVQGGHVRVDLVYSPVSHATKRVIDMVGSLLFMMPFAAVVWMYSWFFLWRHLVTPKVSASDTLDRTLMKARAIRWNVETIGFSPNGFNAYFLFKILLVLFAGLIFLQAIAFFYRSYLEWKGGPLAEGRYLDRDTLGAGETAFEGTH